MFLDMLIKDEDGETLGKVFLYPKDFKTGSVGFFGQDKVSFGGKRYQVQAQLVEIGSKNAGEKTEG